MKEPRPATRDDGHRPDEPDERRVRFLGERLSADLALVAPLGAGSTFVVAIVNFVWRFPGD